MPMTTSLTPIDFAIRLAPSTSHSAPSSKVPSPTISQTTAMFHADVVRDFGLEVHFMGSFAAERMPSRASQIMTIDNPVSMTMPSNGDVASIEEQRYCQQRDCEQRGHLAAQGCRFQRDGPNYGGDTEYEANIDNIGADRVADGETRLPLKGGDDRYQYFGCRRGESDNSQPDQQRGYAKFRAAAAAP